MLHIFSPGSAILRRQRRPRSLPFQGWWRSTCRRAPLKMCNGGEEVPVCGRSAENCDPAATSVYSDAHDRAAHPLVVAPLWASHIVALGRTGSLTAGHLGTMRERPA